MPHPLLEHVQRDAVHGGVDPEAIAQSLRTAVRRIRDPGLDHDPLDDLRAAGGILALLQAANGDLAPTRKGGPLLHPCNHLGGQCPPGEMVPDLVQHHRSSPHPALSKEALQRNTQLFVLASIPW